MGDLRDRLNLRREKLLRNSRRAQEILASPLADSDERGWARAIVDELCAVEATIATMQLADAQREVAQAQREVAEAQRDANSVASEESARGEEVAFWVRRFLTSMTVGNVAGLFAILLFLTKSDSPLVSLPVVRMGLLWFLLGSSIGAVLPLAKAGEAFLKQSWSGWITIAVGAQLGCLAAGTATAINAGLDFYEARSEAAEGRPSKSPISEPAQLRR